MKSLLLLLTTLNLFASILDIHILDKQTHLPVKGAYISTSEGKIYANCSGKVTLTTQDDTLFIRAFGYKQKSVSAQTQTLLLESFTSKALYVSFWAAGSSKYINRILELAKNTEINTVVIDVKNEFGSLLYKTDVSLAEEIGAHKERTVFHIDALIKKLKEHNLYVIGRVVVFKDEKLASHKDEYALKESNTSIWRNRENLAWVDPFEEDVHEYVSDIAADAASRGFDEINFDYVRFPLKKGLSYKKTLNQENRIQAISDFLKTANKKLRHYNVYTSVDTYGYVCWNEHDTNIGHTIKSLSNNIDYIAPMLYPSGFGSGILNYKDPTDHPYEIINESIKEGLKRADISPLRFRPWLQSFKDYGFDRKFFRSKEVFQQIKGAEDASCSGWMLWNPSSRFSSKGLQDAGLVYPILPQFDESIKHIYRFKQEKKEMMP